MGFSDDNKAIRDSIKEIMADVEKHNNVKATFGEPIREKDAVLIPVAAVYMRGGGGGGRGEADQAAEDGAKRPAWGRGKGIGIGYSRQIRPMGYIEIRDGKACFKPVVDMGRLAALATIAGTLGFIFMAKVIMAQKGQAG